MTPQQDSDDKEVIRIVKKESRGHEGSHGGSWKVAYADFVTAMMAFFLVMWIINMDDNVKQYIQGYFQNPVGYEAGKAAGSNPAMRTSSGMGLQAHRARERAEMRELAQEIRRSLESGEGLSDIAEHVNIEVTDRGLRIEFVEDQEEEIFFPLGSADLQPAAGEALRRIAPSLNEIGNPIVIEGHTDSRPVRRESYSNWELSTDRANAARRALRGGGLEDDRVEEVIGHADRDPSYPSRPRDARNRRFSVLLPFTTEPPPDVGRSAFGEDGGASPAAGSPAGGSPAGAGSDGSGSAASAPDGSGEAGGGS